MTKRIQISPADRKTVAQFLKEGKKIAAIKHARAHGKVMPGEKQDLVNEDGLVETVINHKVGLREAKDACEHLVEPKLNPTAVLSARLQIRKVIVEGETGNVELDIEQLQLRCLDGLSQGIPLSEVGAMTELITFIREWQGE